MAVGKVVAHSPADSLPEELRQAQVQVDIVGHSLAVADHSLAVAVLLVEG